MCNCFNEFVSSCSETRFDWDYVDLPGINQYLLCAPITKSKRTCVLIGNWIFSQLGPVTDPSSCLKLHG